MSSQWRVQTPEGHIYGPVTRPELDRWVAEGRLDAGCQLNEVGQVVWVPAEQEYPHLKHVPAAPAPATSQTAMTAPSQPTQAYLLPHRGPMLLVFGILGIVMAFSCPLLFFFAPTAWIMARKDLAQIREGRMDPAGLGLSQAAHVLGIVGTILGALYLLLWVAYFLFIFLFIGLAAAGGGGGGPQPAPFGF